MNGVYDRTGRSIEPGDVVKVSHYIDPTRKRKVYMYKQVAVEQPTAAENMGVWTHHLPINMTEVRGLPPGALFNGYWLKPGVRKDVEVVDGHCWPIDKYDQPTNDQAPGVIVTTWGDGPNKGKEASRQFDWYYRRKIAILEVDTESDHGNF